MNVFKPVDTLDVLLSLIGANLIAWLFAGPEGMAMDSFLVALIGWWGSNVVRDLWKAWRTQS